MKLSKKRKICLLIIFILIILVGIVLYITLSGNEIINKEKHYAKLYKDEVKDETTVNTIINEYYLEKNENGKYEVDTTIVVENENNLKEIILKDEVKTIIDITSNRARTKIAKDMILEIDKEYKVTIITANGENIEKTVKVEMPDLLISAPYIGTSSASVEIGFYAIYEKEIKEYAYIANGKTIATLTSMTKTYNMENCFEPETEYTLKVTMTYNDGTTKDSNEIKIKTKPRIYLYNNGNECESITGGWRKTGYHVQNIGTFEKNKDSMYIFSPSRSRIFCGTTNAIDLSKYAGLCVESEGSALLYQISKVAYYNDDDGSNIGYQSEAIINISDYNSQYYIHFSACWNSYQTIKRVWLEY